MLENLWGDRRSFTGQSERSTWAWRCFTVGLLAAAIAGYFLLTASIHWANGQRAQARKQMRHETRLVVSRGPYSGDAADVAYRVVTVRFPGWNHEPVEAERMMGWDTYVGQKVQVLLHKDGRVYMPKDLDQKYGNFWHVSSGLTSAIIASLILSFFALLAMSLGSYSLWLAYRRYRWRRPVSSSLQST